MTSVAQKESRRTAKRGNGEGSIYWWEAINRYAAAITLANGKRKVITATTRTEVANKLMVEMKQKDDRIPFTPERLTLGNI